MARKGIILAGGTGSRLWPVTKSVSKQLLPIYDKPMVYYPLSLLMRSKITDVLVITTPHEQNLFVNLLGDGSQWGMNIQYAIQPSPDGLAQAFIIGEDFIGNDCVSLVLGDNIFYGGNLMMCVDEASVQDYGATVFAYRVNKPEDYGVVEFDELDRAISLDEKPQNPKSNYAVTGLYFYDNDVVDIAKSISPSKRGELEITCVNNVYLQNDELRVAKLSRGCTWFDAGTFDNMLQISNYIETVQTRQGQIVASPDEIAYRNGWITFEELIKLINSYGKSLYAKQLYESILED